MSGITPQAILTGAVVPACAFVGTMLRRPTGDPRALVELMAIGFQESGLQAWVQHGDGPAHGPWQFEGHRGQALDLIMRHPRFGRVLRLACLAEGVPFTLAAVHAAIALPEHTWLAAVIARLNLACDPRQLPAVGDIDEGWVQYIRNWQPGRPRPELWKPKPGYWQGNYAHAQTVVATTPLPTLTGEAAMGLRQDQIDRMLGMMQAAAASPVSASDQKVADRSLTLDLPNGTQIAADPPQLKNAWRKGSTYLALVVSVMPYIAQVISAYADHTGSTPAFSPGLPEALGSIAAAIIAAGSSYSHGQAVKTTGAAVQAIAAARLPVASVEPNGVIVTGNTFAAEPNTFPIQSSTAPVKVDAPDVTPGFTPTQLEQLAQMLATPRNGTTAVSS